MYTTTTDSDAIEPRGSTDLRYGDGGYAVDGTALIADLFETVIDAGGRVPTDPYVGIDHEGYAAHTGTEVFVTPDAVDSVCEALDALESREEYAAVSLSTSVSDQTAGEAIDEALTTLRGVDELDETLVDALAETAAGERAGDEFPDGYDEAELKSQYDIVVIPGQGSFGDADHERGRTVRDYAWSLNGWPSDAPDCHRIGVRIHIDAGAPYFG